MIRIILALIGVAFCILSSLSAPAHAASVQVPYDNALLCSAHADVIGDLRDPGVIAAPYLPGPDIRPDLTPLGNDLSWLPEQTS